jgi:integrase
MRWHVGDGYKVETIGTADDTADSDGVAILSYRHAQALIREKHVEYVRAANGLPAMADGPYTVETCVRDYLDFLETHRKSGPDTRYRIEALIVPALGATPCADLTAPALREWLESAAQSPPRRRTGKGQDQRFHELDDADPEQRRRRRASANRVWVILRAALNRAWQEGKIASDDAWRRVRPFDHAVAARVRYLTIDECRRLINTAHPGFRELVKAALFTGCRFGELATLQVHDFNPDAGTIQVRRSKGGKARHVVLNDEGVAFFSALTAGRAGLELMLCKPDGGRWGKSNQSRPMREACERAKIDPPANFHCLRHTYASHAVMAGAPLLVVARNLGHADTQMVERHYGHLAQSYIVDAIRAAAPRFGIGDDHTVTPIAGRAGA